MTARPMVVFPNRIRRREKTFRLYRCRKTRFDCFYSLVALAESDVDVLDGQQNFSAVFVERTLFRERIHAVFVLVDLRFPVVADALKVSLDFPPMPLNQSLITFPAGFLKASRRFQPNCRQQKFL